MGYYELESRFVLYHDIETGAILTEDEFKRRYTYDVFDLFVDPIVDRMHHGTKTLFGLNPIDEPLLSNVFLDGRFTMSGYFGREIMLPRPEILISMKINSVLNRNKEHKGIKDIADIYALVWYSGTEFADLKYDVQKICGIQKISTTVSAFTNTDYGAVSRAIGVGKDEVSRVIAEIAKR